MAHNPAFDSLLDEMRKLHFSKNHDYAQDGNPYSNFCQAADVAAGFSGIDAVFATMIGVKLARLRELTSAGKTPNNESIADTRKDLAMYAALWASYYDHVRDSRISGVHDIVNTSVLGDTATTTVPGPHDGSHWRVEPLTYDERRAGQPPCACGRWFTHPEKCHAERRCLALDHPHASAT